MQSSNSQRRRSVLAPAKPKKRLLDLKPSSIVEEEDDHREEISHSTEDEFEEEPEEKPAHGVDIIFEWQAPERMWKPKDKAWYLTSTVVVMVLILISAKFGYFIIILGLIAVLMLWFVQGTLEPWTMLHKITSRGIYTNSKMILWDQIDYFWFTKKKDQVLLHLLPDRELPLPRFTLLVNNGNDFEIFSILHEHIKYGSQDNVNHAIFSNLIDGQYLPITLFVPDLDQPLVSN